MKRALLHVLLRTFLGGTRPRYNRDERTTRRATNWTAGATVAMALFAFISTGTAVATAIILRNQLREMQSEERPWISVEIVPQALFPLGQKDGRRYYFGGIPFDMYLSNVGRSPAFNVNPSLFGYIDGPGHADPETYQRARCNSVAQQKLDNPARGSVLFPGQDHIPVVLGGFSQTAGFTDEEVRKYGAVVDGHMTVQLWVIGCVDYFSADKMRHQTGFVDRIGYLSKRSDGSQGLTFSIPIDGAEGIPAENFRLYPSPTSSVRTD